MTDIILLQILLHFVMKESFQPINWSLEWQRNVSVTRSLISPAPARSPICLVEGPMGCDPRSSPSLNPVSSLRSEENTVNSPLCLYFLKCCLRGCLQGKYLCMHSPSDTGLDGSTKVIPIGQGGDRQELKSSLRPRRCGHLSGCSPCLVNGSHSPCLLDPSWSLQADH